MAKLAVSASGPALIVAVVVVILHDVVFNGVVSGRNPDLLAFWMPNQCFLGQELTAGRIPYWNPHAFAGIPFAADPQSGWMYLPMMVFGLAPCDIAIRALVVFFPIVGGVGAYAFLRGERVPRAPATIAGLCIAGVTAGSALAVTLTFVAVFAWSPWMLAAASRALRSGSWSGRLGWATVTALLWGQLAAAHISNGLVMGSVLLAFFSLYKATQEVRAGRLSTRSAVSLALLGAMLLVLANLAYLLPRLIYLERSTIALGYEGLLSLRNELWGRPPPTLLPSRRITEPEWILRLATSPGAYLGAIPLTLSFAGLFSARRRALAAVLWIYVVLFYAAGTRQVAEALQPLLGDSFLGDFYLHAPSRFGYAPILGLCLLAGLGAAAWRDEPSWRTRASMMSPGVLVWGLAPLLAGVVGARMLLVVAAALVTFPLLFWADRRTVVWTLLVVALAAELAFNGIYGQARRWEPDEHGLTDPTIIGVEPLPEPEIDTAAFVSRLPLLEPLGAAPPERWIAVDPPLYLLGRETIHGINEAQGYNPVQLLRYWTYARTLGPATVDRSPRMTVFKEVPAPAALDLLYVRYVATASSLPPEGGFGRVGAGGGWTVWEVPDASPPASLLHSHRSVASADEALAAVTRPGFDPSRTLILERQGASAAGSRAPAQPVELRRPEPGRVEATIDADRPGFLLFRIPYEEYWTAEIDGRPAEVVPANYLLQAVEVAEGNHLVRLAYRDPWVTRGLWGSAAVLATVTAACVWMRRRRQEGEPD